MFYLVLALVFALAVAIFAINNAAPVAIKFLVWQFPETSLALVVLGSAVLGATCIGLLALFKQIGFSVKAWELQARIRRLEGEKAKLEEELAGLKESRTTGTGADL